MKEKKRGAIWFSRREETRMDKKLNIFKDVGGGSG